MTEPLTPMTGAQANVESRRRDKTQRSEEAHTVRGINRRTTALAIGLLACFLLLAWRTEVQDNRLEEAVDRASRLSMNICEERNENVKRDNLTWETLADIERDNPIGDPDVVRRRIELYESAKLTLPACTIENVR